MNTHVFYLTVLFLVNSLIVYSQEEVQVKKIRFGLDLGLDIPNNRYSQFLEGSHPFGVTRFFNNPTTRTQIENQLGYPIKNWEFSKQTNYQPAVFAGLYLGFDLKPHLSVIMKLNFSIVKFSTPFVLSLDNPQNFTGEFEQATITASEQRFLYALGIEKKIPLANPKITPYFSLGGCFNYIQLERHEMVIRSTSYNIMRVNNTQTLTYQKIDGFGYGGYVEGGISFWLSDKFTIALGGNLLLQSNKEYVEQLTENTAYLKSSAEKAKKILPNFNSYIRIIWN